jgi:hypothetical protein
MTLEMYYSHSQHHQRYLKSLVNSTHITIAPVQQPALQLVFEVGPGALATANKKDSKPLAFAHIIAAPVCQPAVQLVLEAVSCIKNRENLLKT